MTELVASESSGSLVQFVI